MGPYYECMDSGPADADSGVEDAFHLLGHRYRRYVVRTLDDHRSELALADLADEVACREHDEPISDIPSEAVSQVYMALYHTHVPKLADGDAVFYDQGADVVVPRDRIETLVQILDAVDSDGSVP